MKHRSFQFLKDSSIHQKRRYTISKHQHQCFNTNLNEYNQRIMNDYKFYSQDLLNNLFKHPYTKIEFLEQDLGVSRITAATYLNKLADDGLLRKEKLGTANYYVNYRLFEILSK